MKKITHNQTLTFNFLDLLKSIKFKNLTTLLFVVFLNSVHFQTHAQDNTENDKRGKESIRKNGTSSSKASKKTNFQSFSSLNSYTSSNSTNVCSPESSLLITQQSSWGISRSTINNSGSPSFCLSLYDDAPKEDDIFNTTLTPLADISFNNNNYTNAQIIDKVRRTLSVMKHSDFAPSTAPTSLTSNFYKAVAVVVWHYTDNLSTNSYNYSWTGADGNTYSVSNIKTWVSNGTLQASDAIWLVPENNSRQPEVLLNTNTSSDCCPTPPSITTSTNAATSNNNGEIILESVSGAQYYGISSLDASSYDGPTTIATATAIPNSLPSTILSNAPKNGGTYIIRAFTNIDGCFTDYTITTPGIPPIDCNNIDEWDKDEKYDEDELVKYEGKVYKSLKDNKKNKQPDEKPDYWEYQADCLVCEIADNTTSTTTITENETKTLTASPAGGTFSIVSGGGTINGNTFTPADINGDTDVTIKYTIAANGSCAETSDDVTFNVKVLPAVTVSQTNVSCYGLDDGSITFNFDDATTRTHIEFSLDGGNNYETKVSDDSESVTYSNLEPGTYDVWVRWGNGEYPRDLGADITITEPAEIVVNNTTTGLSISENQTKTLSATPAGGTWSIVSGGGTINGNEYVPGNINTNTTVKIRYTIPANGTCSAVSDDVTFTITPICLTANNTTSTATITEDEAKTLSGSPVGGTWSIVSGGGTINGNTYSPDDINTNTTVVIRYTIAADGSCAATSDDVTFTVTPVCDVVADNTTSTASITEGQTKTLTGAPNGGTWSIVSGGGSINGTTYTPDDINTNTTVVIRYTIAADGSCAATTDDVTFTVTPVCDVVADNTTSTSSITEGQTKTLTGAPNGGTWSIVSGGGSINGTTYTPDDINTNTTVIIRYTIAADGDCAATIDDVTFTVTPVCNVVADNTTSTASITEGETKTLTGAPAGGTWSIVSGGGSINGTTYTPDDINTNTTVVIRYTIAADGSCAATTDDVTFTVTPVCDVVADNTTSTSSITEGETKTLTATPESAPASTIQVDVEGNTLGVNLQPARVIQSGQVLKITGNGYYNGTITVRNGGHLIVCGSVTIFGSVSIDNGGHYWKTSTTGFIGSFTNNGTTHEGPTSCESGNWSIVSGGGSINGNIYTPDDINTNTTVVIRYTVPASGSCGESSDDVTFTVTPVCDVVADNTTSTASITEGQTKTLTGAPNGGTWSIVSGGGSINGTTYTPDDINTNTTVIIRYTIAADGDCAATTDDVTFTVTPVCNVVADNTTSTASITEGQTKTLTGAPNGGTWSIVSGGGTINGTTYTPDDINTNTTVVIRYTIAADGSCDATTDDVTFTVTPVITVPSVTQNFESGNRNIESAECWGFGGFSIRDNDKINGNFSARSGSINNTNGSFWLKSPWIELASGDINFDIKLNNTDNQDYYVEISFIPFDPSDNNGEGTPNANTYTHTLQSPLSNSETVSYTVPANLANDGNPYKVRLSVYNQNGNRNRRAIIDDWSIPGENVSVPSNNCFPTTCTFADNTTSTASINENETKTLSGNPAGGTFSIVSGGGTINGTTYTPDDINTNTTVVIRYTIAADGSCAATTDDVTFTVTPVTVCVSANNMTTSATITDNQIKTLAGNPTGGTFSIISGGGSINGNTYTPDPVNSDTTVIIRYTITANGSCAASFDDVTFTVSEESCSQINPTDAALGFNVFTLEGLNLSTNETEGAVATGGDLTISGNYQITTNDPGSFTVNNVPVGLVVDGKVIYQSGNALQINQNTYVKIGESNGSVVWYQDQNSAFAPIRVTKNSSYNSSPRINLQASANQLNVSSTNNPVFEQNVIDFAAAFQSLQTNSNSLAQNSNNAQLTNPNGQSISNTNLPNQVKINLQNGINYLNVTGSDLNNVDVFTYNNKPSASKVLVINVDAPGTFNWDVWNQAGIGQQDAPYIIYNFNNTTTLNIVGNSTIEGSILAPTADINKTVNQSNIEGQVIGKSFAHSGGEVHSANFNAQVNTCAPNTGVSPTADYSTNNNNQCLSGNEFIFTNSSNTNGTAQPNDPITYAWNFGDGTTSTQMNPTKVYSTSGTYTVTLVATNSFGSDTITKQVVVLDQVNSPIISQISINNGNGTVTYEFTLDNDTDFDSFTWEVPGQGAGLFANEKTISVDYSVEGSYNVIVEGTSNGCSNSQSATVAVTSNEVTGGNSGGVESESLGDAISKIFVKRKKNSIPTEFVKNRSNLYNKSSLQAKQPYQGKGQTMLDMFPTELVAGNVANVTSPTDILDYTIADEVLSVDFSLDGKTKGVVLGVKTSDKVYNHTKASCDRLRGAEILNVIPVQLAGYNFLMQGIKQRNGVIEYAISFAAAKNNNDNNYTLQTNWYVNNYTKYNDMYNFQVWTTNPEDTYKLVLDIIKNLKSFVPVTQTETQKVPKTYAAKISRDKADLVILLRSTKEGLQTEITMDEIYSETANNVKHRYNPVSTKIEQELRIDIADGYEYDALLKVAGEVEDAFYHADGNWGLDFDSKYTEIKEYFVSNNFNRTYQDDEYAINRNVKIKATSDFDYLTVYKSLLPGTLSADYSEYNYVSFTAKGSGLIELGLIKSSIEDWKAQYRVMVDLSEEEQTYYVPFDIFTSSASQENLTAEDLTTLMFTFLPVEAQTKELDLEISDVKFTKTAVDEQVINKIEKFENEFMAYPNPSKGNVNLLLFSEVDTEATITLTDITGKTIYRKNVSLTAGKNELDYNFRVKPGVMLLKVASKQTNYGTSKIIFR